MGEKNIIGMVTPAKASATAISGPPSSSRTKTGISGEIIAIPIIATNIANQSTMNGRVHIAGGPPRSRCRPAGPHPSPLPPGRPLRNSRSEGGPAPSPPWETLAKSRSEGGPAPSPLAGEGGG